MSDKKEIAVWVLVGMMLVYDIQLIKAITWQAKFGDPVPTSKCADYQDNVYWSWETLTFETNWTCVTRPTN